MNENKIITDRFSNPEAEKLYRSGFENDPELYKLYAIDALQCGGCSFYAKFNTDWGLCCHAESPHHLETVFEHFTCRKHVHEGWSYHSFVDFDKSPVLKKYRELTIELPESVYNRAKKRADRLKISVIDVMTAMYMKLLHDDAFFVKLLNEIKSLQVSVTEPKDDKKE